MLLLSHEKVNVFSLWTVCWRLLCSLLRRNKHSQINLTLALLRCSERGCHVLVSHTHYATSFPPKRSFLCQTLAAASLPYKHAFSKFILLFVWRNKCDWLAVLLHQCCMILSWPLLSISNSALMRFLQIYVTGEEPLCVWKCVMHVCVCVWELVHTCQWTLMMAAVKSCTWTLGNPNYLSFIFITSFPLANVYSLDIRHTKSFYVSIAYFFYLNK